ncbi:DNA polymerase III, subunit gamma and tau [candidate division WS6 bacterium RIFOXYC1_FULL_33_9]|nr:MAG: DNA polymerase III, subunit gamma and tau [candidate division WS6 bacterium RIFOXYB1_FULL_33_15]OGC37857.1 MAG: DNA polymerase III, subunit gamma and tau [candidate division WS6 bacterium RIFOXYC1_FULL_33_9]
MSNVLYRKYRAQNFDELVGQDHITKILKNAIKGDQLSHAYLFVGSRGTGKTTTARVLAKAVNCLKPKKDGNPCNKCEVCLSVSNGTFLDLVEIDAASNRGIDQIRELKERIEFSPVKGKYKIYIIDEVHMLTNEAFNALLKTLEEPPEHIIFILATTDAHKLPPTILSRCQRYDFRLGTEKEIRDTLLMVLKNENINIEEKGLEILVRNARGSYRDALSLLDVVINAQIRSENAKEITEDEVKSILGIPEMYLVNALLESLLRGDSKKSLECISELEIKGINLTQFTSFTLEVLREVLVSKISGESDGEYTFAKDLKQRDILNLIKEFLNVERDLKNSTNQILIYQMLIPTFSKDENFVKDTTKLKEKGDIDTKNTTILQKKSETVEVVCSDGGGIEIVEVGRNWEKIANGVKPKNATLFAFLGASKPVSVDGDVLNIEVPFKFYKDQIDSPVSRELISGVIFEVLGVHCRLKCNVNEGVRPRLQSSADVVLKNVPVIEKKQPKEEKKSFTPRKVAAEVEAIFAGM